MKSTAEFRDWARDHFGCGLLKADKVDDGKFIGDWLYPSEVIKIAAKKPRRGFERFFCVKTAHFRSDKLFKDVVYREAQDIVYLVAK